MSDRNIFDRMRARTAGWRPDRRQFVAAGIGAALTVGSKVAWEGLGIAFERTIVDPVLDPPQAPRSFSHWPLEAEDFPAMASDAQRAALDLWSAGSLVLPSKVGARCTVAHIGSDGRFWIRSQGDEIARIMWGGSRPVNVPMAEQEDPEFGAWAEERVGKCLLSGRPMFDHCRVVILQADGQTRLLTYTALLVPRRDQTVLSVTAGVPATGLRGPRRPVHSSSREDAWGRNSIPI